jgi:hypothetical protein|uniref:C2H2-type domain-containing protein n=1 Tax=viral metagenome TaxID=1070528 RepID=A0A6C0J7L4_9ZZZZ
MTGYICYDCSYCTDIRTHYHRHLTTNKHKKNYDAELKKGIKKSHCSTKIPQNTTILDEKSINLHKNTTKYHKNTTKIHTFQKYTKKFECDHCTKKYSRIDSLNRHMKDSCKAKQIKDKEIDENQTEIAQLKNQIDRLIDKVGNKTNITNIDNTNNSKTNITNEMNIKDNVYTNNNNLNVFGKENLDMVTDDIKKEMIKGPFKMMPKLLELIYFNKKYPENHTMKLVNKNKEIMKVHNKKGWELVDKVDTIDYLLEDKNYTLDSFYDTNTEIFSKMIKKTYNNFRNLFDSRDKELWKQIKRDVDLLLWNNM